MTYYLYQMYDTKLGAWVFHQFMNGTPEQVGFSVKSLSIKKPESLVDKQDGILYCSGEVDAETGVIKIYDDRELVFDYRTAFKSAFPEEKELEKVEDGKEGSN